MHSLHGVGAQIHRYLVQIGGISDHGCGARVDPAPQMNACGQRRFEQFERLLNDRLNVYRRAVAEPAATESENALDQLPGTLGGMHDVVEIAPQGAAFSGLLLCQFAVPQDCSKYVIEVMGNAAGQRADCFHLLRLPQLRFQLFLVHLRPLLRIGVHGRTDESDRFAGHVTQTTAARVQPVPVTIRLPDAIFAFIAERASFEMICERGVKARHVLGMNDDLRQPDRAGGDLTVRAQSVKQFHLGRQKQAGRRDVPVPMPFVCPLHRERVALLAFPQRPLAGSDPAQLPQ